MSERQFAALGATSIVLAAFFVYWPQLGFYFTDVDTFTLISTSRFETLDEFLSMLGSPMMNGQLSNALFYRPFSSITWAIDHMIWGVEPLGYHLTDLLLHTATSLVFFSLMLGIAGWRGAATGTEGCAGRARTEALVAGLLFAVHPVAMETVPAIARRPDLLFGLFSQLTLLSVFWFLRERRPTSLILASAFCVLGIASKDSAVAIPAIAVAFAICFSAEPTLRARVGDGVRVAAPLLLAAALYIAIRVWVLGGIGGYGGNLELPFVSVFKTSVTTLLCAGALPGSLDRCTPAALPIIGIGFVLLFAACAAQFLPPRASAAARRFTFGATALSLFLALYIVVRTPAHTRTLYALLPFLCILVAWGTVDGALLLRRALGRREEFDPSETPGTAGFRAVVTAARALSGAIFGLVAASIVHGGFSRVYLDEWREIGATMQETLAWVAPHIETLEVGSKVYLLNFPHKISNPRPVLRDHPLFQDHSIQGWADLVYPEKKLDVVGLSYVNFHLREPKEVRFEVSFDAGLSRLSISLGEGGEVVPYSTDSPYGKDHPLGEVWRERDEHGHRLVIDLTSDAMISDHTAFLIYLGDRVSLENRDSWSVRYDPMALGGRASR